MARKQVKKCRHLSGFLRILEGVDLLSLELCLVMAEMGESEKGVRCKKEGRR